MDDGSLVYRVSDDEPENKVLKIIAKTPIFQQKENKINTKKGKIRSSDTHNDLIKTINIIKFLTRKLSKNFRINITFINNELLYHQKVTQYF